MPLSLALAAAPIGFCSESKPSNPYLDIPRNNPFRLVAPEVTQLKIRPEARPTEKIRLVGISTVGGRSSAFLEIQQIQRGTVSRPILHEREQFADINIMGIDAEKGTALVRIGAKAEKLSIYPALEKDSGGPVQALEPVKYRK